VRARILERDGESCGFCGTEHDLQIDHIFPVALGGKSDDDNLQVLCGPCNRAKGARHDG
jgi:5-methylcytosine-specific restriction endonuclease McrA